MRLCNGRGRLRPLSLAVRGLGLVAVAASAVALAGPTSAHAALSGTLELRQQSETPSGLAELGYRFDSAPLLSGPAASARLGLDTRIRATASHYVPMSLSSFTATGDAIPVPDALQCDSWTCCDGLWSFPDGQSVAIADAHALLQLDEILLDVGRGRGEVRASLARAGAGALSAGEYVAPGSMRVTTNGCHYENGDPVLGPDGTPYFDVSTIPAVAQNGEALMRRYAPESLERDPVRVHRHGGAWRGAVTVQESGPATLAKLTLALRGTPAGLGASCKLPRVLAPSPRSTIRSRKAALRQMRRAGFTHARYGGVKHGVVKRLRGRYGLFDASASAYLPCAKRVTVRRGAG